MTGSRLNDADRLMIARAHEVAALDSAEARRQRYGDTDSDSSRAAALGEAQWLLGELAAIIVRLDRDATGTEARRAGNG